MTAARGEHQTHQVEQAEEIHDLALGYGEERLSRSSRDMFITAVIGAAELSLGALAAMVVLGASLEAAPSLHLYGGLALAGVVFPVAFLFVILGRSELFTENFLVPVVAVLEHRQPLSCLARLWGVVWLGNMAGCVGFALLASIPDAVGEPLMHGYTAYAAYKLSVPPVGILVSAIFAGMVMTVMTWVLVAVRDAVGRILVMFGAGYVLFATNLSHTVVGSALIFVGFHGAGKSVLDVAEWVALATVGNTIGGAGLVTLGRMVQVKAKRRGASLAA